MFCFERVLLPQGNKFLRVKFSEMKLKFLWLEIDKFLILAEKLSRESFVANFPGN